MASKYSAIARQCFLSHYYKAQCGHIARRLPKRSMVNVGFLKILAQPQLQNEKLIKIGD